MKNISLESAESAFNQWREQRSSRAERIPDHLWSMALALYPQHKRSAICRELALSIGQFNQRLARFRSASTTNTGFVLASNDEPKVGIKGGDEPKLSTNVASEVQLVIQGKERTLTLSVSKDALLQLLPHIGALL